MKQKDIALVIVIVFISAIFATAISKLAFGAGKKDQQVEVVDVISDNFPSLSSKYFNSNSIDPTQLIKISENDNTNPFSGSQ